MGIVAICPVVSKEESSTSTEVKNLALHTQDSTRDNKTEIINLEDSILRREEDVEIIDSSDNDDGSDSDFDDLIDDQILEEFYDELDENNVADDVESGYGVGLSIESSLQSKNRVKLVPEGSEKF